MNIVLSLHRLSVERRCFDTPEWRESGARVADLELFNSLSNNTCA